LWYDRIIDRHRSIPRRVCLVLIWIAVLAALAPATALASDSIFWDWATLQDGAVANSGISVAASDGSGGRPFAGSGPTVVHPLGVAIDSLTGTIYWANFGSSADYCSGTLTGGNTISYARLDGMGTGNLNTAGATVRGPDGVTVDPTAGRIYWANEYADKISYANLDGTGGGDINTTGATVDCPAGVAIDPAEGRVYWTNLHGDKISYANLNGSGGGDLRTTGATVSGPWGLAIDSATGRIYWANNDANTISYAQLDGSGGHDLNTMGATVAGPWGVAIDPAEGEIYWANNLAGTISEAALDGSGGEDLSTSGAPADHPKYTALLQPPADVQAPVVTGGSTAGSTLSCSPGAWASDLPEAFLYRAPQLLVYAWSRNGTPIAGTSDSIVASQPGRYECRVTASNWAGATAQTSAAVVVVSPPPVAIAVKSHAVSSAGVIRVRVLVPGPGMLVGVATLVERRALYGTARISVNRVGAVLLAIRPTGVARRLLARGRPLKLRLALAFIGRDGTIGRGGTPITTGSPTAH
jgi:hypothetical protein